METTLLRKVTLYDGLSSDLFETDIKISKEKISEIGQNISHETAHIVNGEGLIACPGFIDVHCHTDLLYPENRTAPSKIMQGITTDIGGLCGLSRFPCENHTDELTQYLNDFIPSGFSWNLQPGGFSELRNYMNQAPNVTNLACFIGHGTLRVNAAGMANRILTPAELEIMKSMLRQALVNGVKGLSSGLAYAPGYFATQEELIELCKELVPFGGIYNSHIRDEGPFAWQALDEAAEIARISGCSLHISHHKVMGLENKGFSLRSLELFQQWQREGLDVTFDIYPYNYGSTSLGALLPKWIYNYSRDQLRDRIPELCHFLSTESNLARFCGWDHVIVAGQSLAQRALLENTTPQKALVHLFLEQEGQLCLYRCAVQQDIDRLLLSPNCMIGSDGYPREYEGITATGTPHPRSYGAFPRFISEFVFRRKLLPLHEALRRITSLPATVFSLSGRGKICCGAKADLVLFDPRQIKDKSTYEYPNIPPEGIISVFVNGVQVVENGIYHRDRCKGQLV